MTTSASLWDCLAESARRFPDKPAVRFYGSALSYAELVRQAAGEDRAGFSVNDDYHAVVGVQIDRGVQLHVGLLREWFNVERQSNDNRSAARPASRARCLSTPQTLPQRDVVAALSA